MRYYTEIENNFFIPVNDRKRINHELDGSKLPKWFYEKYQELIHLIPKIKEMFLNVSLDGYYNSKNNRQYDKGYLEFLFQKYKKEYLKVSSDLKEDLTLLEIKNSIWCWGNILDFIFMIDHTLFEKDDFIDTMQLFNSALMDIGEMDGSLQKAYLRNQWLLTSRGYLYNMRSTAHEAGDYNSYYQEKAEWFLTKKESYICRKNKTLGKIDLFPEFSNPSIILEHGYITENSLDLLLHYIDYYPFNGKIYDSKTIMTAMGIIELRRDLMDFFEELDLHTVSPKDSFRRVIEITNGNYLDTLIRCCHVSKITSSPYKTIVTSRLTAKDDFSEYLEKGYNVCFVPPIIISKETGTVEELNMDSPIVRAYINNEVICESELERGKVYTNHLKF